MLEMFFHYQQFLKVLFFQTLKKKLVTEVH